MAALTGFAASTDTLPPNTVMLSQMMRELDTHPGFTEAFLKQLQGGDQKSGATLLTPDLVDHLRKLIVGKDWAGLDRFPGWTMASITPTVGAFSRFRGDIDSQQGKELLAKYLDIGPYALNVGGTLVDFRQPSTLPGFAADDPAKQLGFGVTRPDGPSPLAATHPESQRLAYAMNRLAANSLDGVTAAQVIWNDERTASTAQSLIDAIAQTGQTVTVTDSRFLANFGHLHWNGQNVMMPFFVDTQILVPGTKRPLLVPVSHAEYEWHIRGPLLNADISFYLGIDGKAEFRTMDELDQSWVMKRDAHTFAGADAVEITRLFAEITRAYVRLHQAHPAAPFDGYYAFGVCQDVAAAVELKMTGRTTLFPNTADDRLFTDKRDAEVNELIRRLPKDRDGKPPDVDRIFGSLPVGPTDTGLSSVGIPGLGDDLIAVHKAWTEGTLKRTDFAWWQRFKLASYLLAIILAVVGLFRSRWWKRSV